MNRYGAMARRHWARWLPQQYAAIGDTEGFFTTLGEDVARQIDDLTGTLAGDDRPGEGYLAQVRRLTMARMVAEEIILRDRVLPDPEPGASGDLDDEDNGDENDKPSLGRERPMVVGRNHPSWAEVDAEQQSSHRPRRLLARIPPRRHPCHQARRMGLAPGAWRALALQGRHVAAGLQPRALPDRDDHYGNVPYPTAATTANTAANPACPETPSATAAAADAPAPTMARPSRGRSGPRERPGCSAGPADQWPGQSRRCAPRPRCVAGL